MIRIFTLKRKAICLASLLFALLSNLVAISQPLVCGPVVEDFNIAANGMAGFTSSTLFSTAPGFVPGFRGQNGYLEKCSIAAAGETYTITTPTYRTLASQTAIGYGFTLSGFIKVSSVIVYVQFIATNGTISTVQFDNPEVKYTNPGTAGTFSPCTSHPLSTYVGFHPGDRYRFVIQLAAASSSNNNQQCITFDDFRTTGGASEIPLPVTFLDITAKKVGSGIEVKWNVAGEKDVTHYEIERSANGSDFSSIGEVAATGSSSYSFMDNQPLRGIGLYRVRNVDVDGKFKYSSIVRVNLSTIVALKAYPMPAGNQITIEHEAINSNGFLSITSTEGKLVKKVQVIPGTTQTPIDLSGVNSGMYIVRFMNGSSLVNTLKIVKQ